jgi:hypothetical protein
MLRQGVQLLERFTQDGRVVTRRPRRHQQIQFTRRLAAGNSLVAFVDAYWRTGWHNLHAGVEDLIGPLSGRAGRNCGA